MSLSSKIRTDSYRKLIKKFGLSDTSRPDVVAKLRILVSINQLAAKKDIDLSAQSASILRLVKDEIFAGRLSAEQIIDAIDKVLKAEQKRNLALYLSVGTFHSTPLHKHSPSVWMEDHHVAHFMPKPYGDIEVFTTINNSIIDPSLPITTAALKEALANPKINHVIIPVGPGHYRGIYISKQLNEKGCATGEYLLEVFGPFGDHDAAVISPLALELLKKSGVADDKITLALIGPPHEQTDAYSCGDYTCAYSHMKMKEWGAPVTAYDERLIKTLEEHGNNGGALRAVTRAISENPSYVLPISAVSAATTGVALATSTIRIIPPLPVITPVTMPTVQSPVINPSNSTQGAAHQQDNYDEDYESLSEKISYLASISFDARLEELTDKAIDLFNRGYNTEADTMLTLHDELSRFKTSYLATQEIDTSVFCRSCLNTINTLDTSKLKQHRGIMGLVNGLISVFESLLGLVCQVTFTRKETKSMTMINALTANLSVFADKNKQKEPEDSPESKDVAGNCSNP